MADEEEFDLELDEFIEEISQEERKPRERAFKTTLPVMSIYEKAKIIMERKNQLDGLYKKYGMFKTTIPEIVKEKNITSTYEIAMLEFDLKKLPPCYIMRRFPDNSYEKWSLGEIKYFP